MTLEFTCVYRSRLNPSVSEKGGYVAMHRNPGWLTEKRRGPTPKFTCERQRECERSELPLIGRLVQLTLVCSEWDLYATVRCQVSGDGRSFAAYSM